MDKKNGLAVMLVLVVVVVLGLTVSVGLAQQPQGSWLSLEASVSPGELSLDDGFLTILTLRNERTESATVDEITVELPGAATYLGLAYGSDVYTEAEVSQSQLRWSGPFNLQAGGELTIRFWSVVGDQASPGQVSVLASARTSEGSISNAESSLSLIFGAEPEPPAVAQPSSAVKTPALPDDVQITKTAVPDRVDRGTGVVYTVSFSNSGTAPVTLDTITDLLPVPFRYVGLHVDSEIGQEPTDLDEPEIVWEGSFVIPAQGTSVLRYWVWVPLETPMASDPFTNRVTAQYDTTSVGPAYADVRLNVYPVYLPMLSRGTRPVTTLPFEDTFAQLSSDWVVFTTPSGPYADQWIWGPAGYYWYDPDAGGHTWKDFALSMYLAPGAQDWSDYQVVTTLRLRDDRLGGVWVRGTYQGGNLGGYYVHAQPLDGHVYLWRFPPGATRVDDATVVSKNDYGPGIRMMAWYDLKVVVQGNNIKAWLKGTSEPESEYRLLIDWTDPDSTWMQGTVGLSAYKAFVVYDSITVTEYP